MLARRAAVFARGPAEIEERRRALGWSIYRLAKEAGLRWQTVQEIEKGRRKGRRETLERIEAALASGGR